MRCSRMVALVLLIACTNVANLLLAQAPRGNANSRFARRWAPRAARMIRQLLAESLLCAIAGGVLGLVLGSWLMRSADAGLCRERGNVGPASELDRPCWLLPSGATLLSGILFGLLPAWRVTRSSVSQT